MQELVKSLRHSARKSALIIRLKLIETHCKNNGDIQAKLINR